MTIRPLPSLQPLALERSERVEWDILDPSAFDRWDTGVRSDASAGEGTVIEVDDVIGEDFWTGGGITAKSVKAQLAQSTGPVTVNINSPGGDYFEGLAIYNTLREHPARVKINVIALAASAASIVMMGGDQVRIAQAAFVMIHNCWGLVIGNADDLTAAAGVFQKFDDGAATVYAARTGIGKPDLRTMMAADKGAGTWFSGDEAVVKGFADGLLPSDAIKQDPAARAARAPTMALRRADMMFARQGMSRTDRRRLLNEIKDGKPGAAVPPAKQDAGFPGVADDLRRLLETIR